MTIWSPNHSTDRKLIAICKPPNQLLVIFSLWSYHFWLYSLFCCWLFYHVYSQNVLVYHVHLRSWSMWGPLVISWFRFAPINMVISTINHNYWSYVHQLSYHKSAINPIKTPMFVGWITIFLWCSYGYLISLYIYSCSVHRGRNRVVVVAGGLLAMHRQIVIVFLPQFFLDLRNQVHCGNIMRYIYIYTYIHIDIYIYVCVMSSWCSPHDSYHRHQQSSGND